MGTFSFRKAAIWGMLSVAIAIGVPSFAALSPKPPNDKPVNIEAKELTHDDNAQTVTAIGDVEIQQNDRILHADKVVYHLDTDVVAAMGNVSILDEGGNVHFMEYAELSGDLKNGYIQSLLSLLADGSRFTASEARRENGVKTTMTDATYTPCKVCETNPKPLWQIKASKVVHNQEDHTIDYKNARLEFMGVPFIYTPIFSHADPSVKRKSGFLRPRYGYSSDVGTFVEGGYYFDIAPDKDATVQVRPTALQGILVQGQWRERFENGRIQIDASTARSDYRKEDGTVERNKQRGHIFAEGLFDLDDKWRAGFDVEHATDKPYLRLYDISKQNVLQTDVYAERFSGRDYTRIDAMAFQDVRLGIRPEQPEVLPMIEHRMYGDPNALWGGRWTLGLGGLTLRRSGAGQDVQRASVDTGWQRQDITNAGFVIKTDMTARADLYAVQDRDAAKLNPALSDTSRAVRGMAVASIVGSYPMVKRIEGGQAVIEPLAGISASPNADVDDPRFPNEDSIDVQLDTNNLFATNRFPGIDKQEDGVRVNYGVKAGLYGDDGRYARMFLGQIYRLNTDVTGYPDGSGLEYRSSDVVGQVSVGSGKLFNGDYRFQLDHHDLHIKRHELLANISTERFDINTGYIFLNEVQGTGFTETREQAQLGGTWRFNKFWSTSSSVLEDLGEEPGLRRATLGVQYADECFTAGIEGTRNLITDVSGEGGTIVLLRLGFKNVGQFATPSIKLRGQEDQLGTP